VFSRRSDSCWESAAGAKQQGIDGMAHPVGEVLALAENVNAKDLRNNP
jgi:hypothetical protein